MFFFLSRKVSKISFVRHQLLSSFLLLYHFLLLFFISFPLVNIIFLFKFYFCYSCSHNLVLFDFKFSFHSSLSQFDCVSHRIHKNVEIVISRTFLCSRIYHDDDTTQHKRMLNGHSSITNNKPKKSSIAGGQNVFRPMRNSGSYFTLPMLIGNRTQSPLFWWEI